MYTVYYFTVLVAQCTLVIGAMRVSTRKRSTINIQLANRKQNEREIEETYMAAVLRAVGRAAAADISRGNGLDGSGGQHDGEDNLTENRHDE